MKSRYVAVDKEEVSLEFSHVDTANNKFTKMKQPKGVFKVNRQIDGNIFKVEALKIVGDFKVLEDNLVWNWYPRHLIEFKEIK